MELAEVRRELRAAGCVFAHDEARALTRSARTQIELRAMVRRRVAGEPLEQIVGWAEFLGHRIAVERGVFVPRRRTELLAREAVLATRRSRDAGGGGPVVVVDLCCGSGAVGALVLIAFPEAEVHAVDVDPAAVGCARRNLPGGAIHLGDLYDPLPARLRGRIDVLAANAPYVPTDEIAMMPAEARQHEPMVALDGGPDGLDVARRILAAAPAWLAPAGTVLIETSDRQADTLLDLCAAAGLTGRTETDDDIYATVLIARRED